MRDCCAYEYKTLILSSQHFTRLELAIIHQWDEHCVGVKMEISLALRDKSSIYFVYNSVLATVLINLGGLFKQTRQGQRIQKFISTIVNKFSEYIHKYMSIKKCMLLI